MKFETKAIRIQTEKTKFREHSTPLFPTSSFCYDNAEQMAAVFAAEEDGYIYSRFMNPGVDEFQRKIAALENTESAFATATGMAAVFASFMAFLKKGDHIISTRSIFGSTFQILSQSLPNLGIETSFVDANDIDSWQSAVNENTKMLYLETPSNPGLTVIDLEKAGKFCKVNNLIFNVDNCFATPYLQNPISYGADIIVHSATKFIDGQGRVLGGAVAGPSENVEKVKLFIRRTGGSISPFNAWILSKSLETLAVRMDRHCESALILAKSLEDHPKITKVNYPFLPSHSQYEIAKKQMSQGGGIVTFEIDGTLEDGQKFLNNLEMLSLTANLGDSRSIASHPASTTHAKVPEEDRLKTGITNSLIRISVGLEHIEDIQVDIFNALTKI